MIVYEENPNSGYIDDSFSNDELDSETEIENALAIINTGLNEKIVRSGYLKKKGEKRKVWKRRWFVFRSNRLSYYKNEKEYKLLKVIPLDDILSVYNYDDQQKYIHSLNTNKSDSTPVSSKPQKQNLMNAFYVNTKERSYLLQAQSVDDRDQWIKALDSSISGKKTNVFNPHEFLVNNNLISSSMANNINQKLNNMNTNNNHNNSNHATVTTDNENVNNTNNNSTIGNHEDRDIRDTEPNTFYTEEDEINHINQMIQNNMALQMPKVNIKEDYSKVYYINNVTQKTQKSKSTKAVNFSTSAPSVHILMDEESDDDTEELMKGDDDDDDEDDEDEEFKTAFEVEVKDKINNDNENDNDNENEDNLEFFNSNEILNVIEKKLKFENEMNITGSTTYGNYSVAKPMTKSKEKVGLLSREKLDNMEELGGEEEEEEEEEEEYDEYDEEDDDDGEEDEYILSSSNDDHHSLSIYSQRKEYLKQQMEKDVIIQQGYMYKYRRNALKKKWKKYWFVIRNGNLFIYKNEQEYVVKSIIPLENTIAICEVKRTSRIGRKGKKNRVRYCFQLIQSIVPKMTEKQFSFDSVHTTSTITDLSNDVYFGRHNSFAEPNEVSSSYSSSVSLHNQNGNNNNSNSSNSNSNNNYTNTINTMNTITEDIITSNFEPHISSKVKHNQSSISQLTNKINNINDNQNNKNNDNNNINNNKNNDDKENEHSAISTNKIKESINTNNTNTEIDNTSTTVEDNNVEMTKKKKTSILKISTNNSNKRLTGSFDSYSSFDDVNKNNTKYKRSSFLANYMNTMSPTGNMTPVTPKRKTFVKVFTFSAPTETSRKIWIANLLNECEKVQEK